ncbi:hypothetical protein KC723_02315 [Candidatus Kaiserbacteria bacterium]|nr:hypothetical protein [Candidatus Kaiserbacteria bacterium]
MEITKDSKELAKVWEKLVNPQTIYDECEFRLAFFDSQKEEIMGVVDSLSQPNVLLPLQKNIATEKVTFISTPFMERNQGFCTEGNENKLLDIYTQVASNYEQYRLDDIAVSDPVTQTDRCIEDENYYVYDALKVGLNNLSELPSKMPKRRLGRQLETALGYLESKVNIKSASLGETFLVIKNITKDRFGSDSWLEDDHIQSGALSLTNLPTKNKLEVYSYILEMNDKQIGGHIGVSYNDVYYALFSGAHYLDELTELPKLVHILNFKALLDAGLTNLDTGLGDCGWKENWGFESVAQYKFLN